MLEQSDIAKFWDNGYLVVEDAVTAEELAGLRAQLDAWIEESRDYDAPYGELIDGRPRFDLAAEHSAETPQLRRVNAPAEVSEAYDRVMRDSGVTDAVAAAIGPDVVYHHCKINLKLPGAGTEVGYHQDFSYTPHTNSDLVTALLMLDDMTMENGPLTVIPGSHKRGQISLWQDGAFTGSVDDAVVEEVKSQEVQVTGKAGSVCLMHTLLLHGSAANRSERARSLYIAVYAAADARPLAANPVPTTRYGEIVRGEAARRARLTMTDVELPEEYGDSSFFEIQKRKARSRAA
jgi:ectoine hydroxylase-related dioxygenase (phytanoyl-CoA dioxygenase family)